MMQDNAYRAADSEPPLSYKETEAILKDLLIGNSIWSLLWGEK